MEDWDKTLRSAIGSLEDCQSVVSFLLVPVLLSIKAGVRPALAVRNANLSGLKLLLPTITTPGRVMEFHVLLC